MNDIFNLDKLLLFLIFFVPGFITFKVWSMLVPTESRKTTDYLAEVISYSCINFAILSGPIYLVTYFELQKSHPVWFSIFILFVLLILPSIWPFIWRRILKTKFLSGFILHPTPKGWDYFFEKGEACYVLVHLKNGKLIGGLYGGDSFASSYPIAEDIYLEEVWKVNEEGEFMEKIENTKGMWISKDNLEYLEFYYGNEVVRDE